MPLGVEYFGFATQGSGLNPPVYRTISYGKNVYHLTEMLKEQGRALPCCCSQ